MCEDARRATTRNDDMIPTAEHLLPILSCPRCHVGSLRYDVSELSCNSCMTRYRVVGGRPVLLRPDNDVFCPQDYDAVQPPPTNRRIDWKSLIPSPSINLANKRILGQMRNRLGGRVRPRVLVVGSGTQRRWLDQQLTNDHNVDIVHTDIDVSADVDLFCDAHDLPFTNGAFDAVVTTAVLEHVLYPEAVAAEIHRVLKVGGMLYSELPFMQQVHEGAYDFTRYTLSGHRRLFNGFSEFDSGMVAGPGTALVWAIENFALSFARRSAVRAATKAAVRFSASWLKYFDYRLATRPEAMDGASCTYFFGAKVNDPLPDADIISGYVGAKHLSHT